MQNYFCPLDGAKSSPSVAVGRCRKGEILHVIKYSQCTILQFLAYRKITTASWVKYGHVAGDFITNALHCCVSLRCDGESRGDVSQHGLQHHLPGAVWETLRLRRRLHQGGRSVLQGKLQDS